MITIPMSRIIPLMPPLAAEASPLGPGRAARRPRRRLLLSGAAWAVARRGVAAAPPSAKIVLKTSPRRRILRRDSGGQPEQESTRRERERGREGERRGGKEGAAAARGARRENGAARGASERRRRASRRAARRGRIGRCQPSDWPVRPASQPAYLFGQPAAGQRTSGRSGLPVCGTAELCAERSARGGELEREGLWGQCCCARQDPAVSHKVRAVSVAQNVQSEFTFARVFTSSNTRLLRRIPRRIRERTSQLRGEANRGDGGGTRIVPSAISGRSRGKKKGPTKVPACVCEEQGG